MKKFAFYVSGSAGRLKKLFDISHEVLGSTFLIYTDSSRALHIQANCLARNIDFVYFDYEKAKTDSKKPNSELSEALFVQLKKHSPSPPKNPPYCNPSPDENKTTPNTESLPFLHPMQKPKIVWSTSHHANTPPIQKRKTVGVARYFE